MAQRLQWFRQQPANWLHWEPANGGLEAHRLLLQQMPQAQASIWSGQAAVAALLQPTGPRRSWLPSGWGRSRQAVLAIEPPAPTDMLWANMCLHLQAHPQTLLRQWQGLVRPQGFLMFSCLGPDSLRELHQLYADLGWHAPSHPFTDMHDWGDMLVQAGFAEPVMDMERIVLTWSTAQAMLDELRDTGRNLHAARPAGLRGRAWRQTLIQAIEERMPRSTDGRLQLTFEIIYGHAYQGEPRRKDPSRVPLDDMRAMLRRPRG